MWKAFVLLHPQFTCPAYWQPLLAVSCVSVWRYFCLLHKEICMFSDTQMVACYKRSLGFFQAVTYLGDYCISAQKTSSFCFDGCIPLPWADGPSLIYPAPCWWTIRWFLATFRGIPLCAPGFVTFPMYGVISNTDSWRGIAGSEDSCMLDFGRCFHCISLSLPSHQYCVTFTARTAPCATKCFALCQGENGRSNNGWKYPVISCEFILKTPFIFRIVLDSQRSCRVSAEVPYTPSSCALIVNVLHHQVRLSQLRNWHWHLTVNQTPDFVWRSPVFFHWILFQDPTLYVVVMSFPPLVSLTSAVLRSTDLVPCKKLSRVGFVWCFLMMNLGSEVWGRKTTELKCLFHPILSAGMWCPGNFSLPTLSLAICLPVVVTAPPCFGERGASFLMRRWSCPAMGHGRLDACGVEEWGDHWNCVQALESVGTCCRRADGKEQPLKETELRARPNEEALPEGVPGSSERRAEAEWAWRGWGSGKKAVESVDVGERQGAPGPEAQAEGGGAFCFYILTRKDLNHYREWILDARSVMGSVLGPSCLLAVKPLCHFVGKQLLPWALLSFPVNN